MSTKTKAAGVLLLVWAALSGCARNDDKSTEGAVESAVNQGRTSFHTYAFGGAGVSAKSRVRREISADGTEALHGTTEVTLPRARDPFVLVESAEIDASGRLAFAMAELRSGPQGLDFVRSVRLDAARGTVSVRDGK